MKYLILSGIIITLMATGCSNKDNFVDTDTQDKTKYLPIEEIWNNTDEYQNQIVALRGLYQGWQGEGIKNPLITRSDWVIKDDTGSIYVTGKTALILRPEKNIGLEIIVKGQVLLNEDMVPYIKATEIIKLNEMEGR
jgi:hypothetical protein